MQPEARDLAPADLQAAMDANMGAWWAGYGRAPGCELRETAEALWFYTGIPIALFNGVVRASFTPESLKATVEELGATIAAHGAPALWWIGPRSLPDTMAGALEGYGLRPAGEIPGMAIELGSALEASEPIPGFAVKKAGAEMRRLWGRVAGEGSGFPEDATEGLATIEASMDEAEGARRLRYIGFLDGKPVATSVMILDSGVAGIYAVATLPEARRRGIGRMMTAVPLLEAREAGYRLGILQASDMGYPVYRSMGFRDVCRYRLYLQG
jgi:ribosomal protein S18 acetylase RimI-like enzyme